MLQRVQDQNKLTIDAYRTVFEGSVDHVTNVGWESDNAIRNLRSYISTVEDEVRDLQNQVDTLKADEHSAARVNNETLGHIREEHSKQMKQIEDNNAQIKQFSEELKKLQLTQEEAAK